MVVSSYTRRTETAAPKKATTRLKGIDRMARLCALNRGHSIPEWPRPAAVSTKQHTKQQQFSIQFPLHLRKQASIVNLALL